VEFVNYKRKVA